MPLSNSEYPEIDVIIIGINVAKYISECIDSIFMSDYPKSRLHVFYVDGGSNDSSVEIAKGKSGVRVIELRDNSPTPGRGRNTGYRASTSEYIQFVDADSYIDPLWFKNALPYFKGNIAAVCGGLRERFPDKNIYHIIGNIEWGIVAGKKGWFYEEGPVKIFGGNVLIKRESLDKTNGFNESLVAGEDPDLSYRVRRNEWEIYRIHASMATHDINMDTFGQYFKRAFKSGHSYGNLCLKYIGEKEKMFLRQFIRVVFGAVAPLSLIVMGVLFGHLPVFLLLAILFAIRPLLKINQFRKKYQLTLPTAFLYTLHLSFVIYPQFFGILRYIYTLMGGKPLQNKGYQVS